ncbi:sigma 54-interacting transcriptional regulator [Rhodoferax mekongensis]|uniref:sigma 54-interacting transcriptional regulator n=1 Tax=Rhodoferax mekongensis TaxID=3068341 RepID=UPI0028BDD81D|nr:sigma 54-interacting transcriptional regulator [Rhodoferax sp. TBRC 17199]MDT7514119.1 sigma 54-interacting transcriptional regulator [Rhodoferax sp. TBRC 17199]
MPSRASRISLADVARATGSVLGQSAQVPAPAFGDGFASSSVSGDAHPNLADISECLFFSPGDGRIWLQDQRVVLMHTEALGSLRREMVDSLGLKQARGLFTRAGYVSGARDAQLVRKQWPDAEPLASAIAGTRLHALEGMVQVELVHVAYDAKTGSYEGEFLWHNSSEDDEHIAAYGVGGSPACWMQVGYATGYVSTLFGRLIVFRELECRSMGDGHCRVVGKSAHQWDGVEEDLRYLNAHEFVDVAAYDQAREEAADLPSPERSAGDAMVGASSAFKAACQQLSRVARTSATVLFTGESGVGKEKFASMLHRISPRAKQPFIAVNCAAIPETLIESELFGVERGAFTGASVARPGRFERAHGGTLFLDEIATLSFVAQGKLLRALQEGQIERVGGTRSIAVDVRVVAATNEALREAVRKGTFREDLFFRLNVVPIHLPPLRERRDDIPLLMNHFLHHYRRKHDCDVKGFSQVAVRHLLNYDFPGNIRELQNLVERAVILADAGGLIDVHHLFTGGEVHRAEVLTLHAAAASGVLSLAGKAAAAAQAPSAPRAMSLDQTEQSLLQKAIAASGGNLSAAARLLHTSRAKLAYRARKHGLV